MLRVEKKSLGKKKEESELEKSHKEEFEKLYLKYGSFLYKYEVGYEEDFNPNPTKRNRSSSFDRDVLKEDIEKDGRIIKAELGIIEDAPGWTMECYPDGMFESLPSLEGKEKEEFEDLFLQYTRFVIKYEVDSSKTERDFSLDTESFRIGIKATGMAIKVNEGY